MSRNSSKRIFNFLIFYFTKSFVSYDSLSKKWDFCSKVAKIAFGTPINIKSDFYNRENIADWNLAQNSPNRWHFKSMGFNGKMWLNFIIQQWLLLVHSRHFIARNFLIICIFFFFLLVYLFFISFFLFY